MSDNGAMRDAGRAKMYQECLEGADAFRPEARPGETGFCSATSVPGIIKGNEGSINGRLTYARILIRRRKDWTPE